MAFDPPDSTLREKNSRKGVFRDVASDIVWKDRACKKSGMPVDTSGAIVRAMENAYKLGKEHGLTDVPGQIEPEAPSDNLLPWKLNQTSLPGGLRAE